METQEKNKDTQMTEKVDKWKIATLVNSKNVSSDVKSLVFSVEGWEKHLPGQHYEIALTSSDGYRAVRNYSIASEPEKNGFLEFGIQLLPEGEVSPYLFELKEGEEVEIHGPLGGHFNWDVNSKGPLVMIAGGSGLVPFISMLRHYLQNKNKDKDNRKIILIVSAKSLDKIPFKEELDSIKTNPENKNITIIYALTKEFQPGNNNHKGRIDMFFLKDTLNDLINEMPMIYVCGTASFVESVTEDLVDMGFNSHEIKTERFN